MLGGDRQRQAQGEFLGQPVTQFLAEPLAQPVGEPVRSTTPSCPPPPTGRVTPACSPPRSRSSSTGQLRQQELETQLYGNNPNNWDNPDTQVVACYNAGTGMEKYALDKSTVTGEMLKLGGSSSTLQTNGDWWVNLTFNGQGTKAFGALSTKMYDSYYDTSTSQPSSELDFFAIVLDGTPVAVPYMGAVLDTGTAQIQGTFTRSQAQNLANVLNYGALPLTFQQESVSR